MTLVYPRSLSAKFKCDFAYATIKDRLPVIITKVIDTVTRLKNDVHSDDREVMWQDLKEITGRLAMMKHELVRDRPFAQLTDDKADVVMWTQYEESDTAAHGAPPSWFSTSWLYAECYFYRRITEACLLSSHYKLLDVFSSQKRHAYKSSLQATISLVTYLYKSLSRLRQHPHNKEKLFGEMLEMSLWSNKCDLSISAMADNPPDMNLVQQLTSLQPHIIANETPAVWRRLQSGECRRVDIVVDNAGFEFVADLCLVEFLLEARLAQRVCLHVKDMPWFVSDVTQTDVDWTLAQLRASQDAPVARLGETLQRYITEKRVVVATHAFWTLPHSFSEMQSAAPDLLEELQKSDLVIFKGDLNYRKLTGDRKWEYTCRFEETLGGFQPAALCALRTCKCDLVVGIDANKANTIKQISMSDLVSGNLGFIQFSRK